MSIEELLARDIAAVTKGVVVTELDLQRSRDEVRERIGSTHRRGRVRRIAVAAAAAVALVAVGATVFQALDDDASIQPADPGEVIIQGGPTRALLEGIWRLDNGEVAVKFGKDGTVRFDERGQLFSAPITTGTYLIDGDLITVTTTADEQPGCVGTTFAMRASFPTPGLLRFSPTDTPGTCSPLPSGSGDLEQVLPTGSTMAGLVFSTDLDYQPVSDATLLHGVWLSEGGGHVLEVAPDGAYYVADSSAELVDVGRWSLRGAELTLTSSARSTACRDGARLVLRSVEWVDPGLGTSAFRGTTEQNACGGAWTPAAWILIPHVGSSLTGDLEPEE